MTETPNWLSQLYRYLYRQEHVTVFEQFVSTIDKMHIPKSAIKGKVCILGHGDAFPERSLICTVKSGFRKLRPDISELVASDPDAYFVPILFDEQTINSPNCIADSGKVKIYHESGQYLLPQYPPDYFDTVTLFRVTQLDEQLTAGLLDDVLRVLKPGGSFIGSGSCEDGKYLPYPEYEFPSNPRYQIIQTVRLSSFDSSGYIYRKHLGFYIKKNSLNK